MHQFHAPPQAWQGSYPGHGGGGAQQHMGWGGPQQWNQHVPPEGGFDEVQVHYTTPPPPEPVVPQGRDGFVRISHRIFVVPEGTAPSAVVEELNDVHNMGVSEKHGMPLDPTGWDDENTFATGGVDKQAC